MSVAVSRVATRGVVFVHSTPTALCPHIEWALDTVLDAPARLEWIDQPIAPGLVRGEMTWTGAQGTGARLASALRGWEHVRYEITEEPSAGADGSRWSHTPSLGIHHTWTSASGDAMVAEDRMRSALAASGGDPESFRAEMAELLGTARDQELEPFRCAGDGASVRWLYRVS